MSGDYSRISFDPSKRFNLVRLQQGRLLSDFDFNQQGDWLRLAHRRAATDIIGSAGFPQDDAGFALTPSNALGGFLIGGGSAYLGGRHVVSDGARKLVIRRKSGSGTNTLWVAKDGPALSVGDLLSKAEDGSGTIHRVSASSLNDDGEAQFQLDPALTPQSTNEIWLIEAVDPQQQSLPTAAGRYLAFLESWDGTETALDDPDLLEVAFDGPDTSTRDVARWQVGLISEADMIGRGLATSRLTCADVEAGLDLTGERARLAARATISDSESGPCTLPPDSGYRSVENHLYRVEIHEAAGLAKPHYKWSRDNGMHRTRYALIEDGALVVDSLGRDKVTALKPGDWIEILDEGARVGNSASFFAQIGDISGQRLILSELRAADNLAVMMASGQPNIAALPPSATIKRWEGGLPVEVDPALGWVELEMGVEVRFQPGAMLAGDHWTIPARALTGDVVWPAHEVTGQPLDVEPEGLGRDYAPLAIVELSGAGSWSVLSDCRPIFTPLTDQLQFDYVSGDGQEAMPDETNPSGRIALGQDLMVSVTRGKLPVAGVRVRFSVTAGAGRLRGSVAATTAITGPDGIANVDWSIDPTTEIQRVRAIRIDADGTPFGTKVEFAANLSRARDTSFDPSNTPELAGALNVQDAIEQLAQIQDGGCETHVITPSNDWARVLEAIPAGSNVSICFAPGTYTTDTTVKLADLGHVKINGSGPGVHLVAKKSECALDVSGCDSLLMRGLTIESTALREEMADKSQFDHRLGALTVTGADLVDIADCTFACGPDRETVRTALTVRARDEGDQVDPIAQVRIVNCKCDVGFLQEGILVHDSIDTIIADNNFSVPPLRNDFLTEDDTLEPKRRAQLLKSLISRLTRGQAVLGKDIREIRAGDMSFTFMSAIPQPEWDKLVRKFPPPRTAQKSTDAMDAYWDELTKMVVEDPSLLPSFEAGVTKGGKVRVESVDPKERRQMLTLREIGSKLRKDSLKGDRNVLIERGRQSVAFNSPVRNSEWQRIIARAEETASFEESKSLSEYVENAGIELLDGTMSRTNFRDFNTWFRGNTKQRESMGFQAIVCAGRRLDTVRVAGNVIRGFNTAIRVAVSHERQSFITGDAVIEDNLCELTTPGDGIDWLQGIYVGNVDRLLVRNNRLLRMKTPKHHNTRYEFGVWVYGFLGRQLLFKDNQIETAKIGFRIKKQLAIDGPMPDHEKRNHQWVIADNFMKHGHKLDLVSPMSIVKKRDNVI